MLSIVHFAEYDVPLPVAAIHAPVVPHRTSNGPAIFVMLYSNDVVIDRFEVGSTPVACTDTAVPSTQAISVHVVVGVPPPLVMVSTAENPDDIKSLTPGVQASMFSVTST